MGSLTRVHAPLREARRWDYLRGRPSAGARSLAGGAEHAFLGTSSGEHMFATVTINPLDKACQVSLARKIGWWGRRWSADLRRALRLRRDDGRPPRNAPRPRRSGGGGACHRLGGRAPDDQLRAARRRPVDRLRARRSAPRALGARAVQLLWVWGTERGAGVLGAGGIDANGAAEAALSLAREAGGRPQGTPLERGSAGGACLASGSLGHSLDIAPGAGAPPFAPPD